jgi:hypothetical protein
MIISYLRPNRNVRRILNHKKNTLPFKLLYLPTKLLYVSLKFILDLVRH